MSWSLWAVPPGRYTYCGNNPVLFVDPTGTFLTHYVDQDNNTLLHTADGSDDVVMVPDSWTEAFRNFSGLYSSGGDHSVYDSRGWNNHWKSEFGLADRQFSDEAIAALDQFSTGWARNNAASFLLKPTLGNALRMGVSEGLSQWTNPELVIGGLSAGVAGLQGTLRGGVAAKGGSIVIGESMKTVKATAKTLQSQGINAKWYQAWSKNFPTNRLMTPVELDATLARNARWLNTKINQNYKIYDIGIDATRTIRSPFYQLEQNILQRRGYTTTKIPR